MGMNDVEVNDVFVAGLLHDIGKIGLPDRLLDKPFSSLTSEERTEVVKHPIKGESVLMLLDGLQCAVKYIRGHHERFDGIGYPDRLLGLSIPLGSRILAVANDYDAAQLGTLLNKPLTQQEALHFIQDGRGNRYDPAVVDAFLGKMVKQVNAAAAVASELMLSSSQLQTGMKLSRDMKGKDGSLLLSKDYILNAQVIDQIKSFERMEKKTFTIWVIASNGSPSKF
jgi:response regulator RpfG family c-di-GMP phosphodiesterase